MNKTHKFFRAHIWISMAVLVSMIITACQKQPNSQALNMEPIEFLNECPINIVNSDHEDHFMVINSPQELNKYIIFNDMDEQACDRLHEQLSIDFSRNTLLIGKKRLNAIQGQLINQNVYRSGNDIVYNVTIKQGSYQAIGQFKFGVLIPKISTDAYVKFNISFATDYNSEGQN